MSNVNTCAVAGNLTRDVELRFTQGGTAVAELGVAVTRNRKDGEEWVEETSFFDVTAWGNLGERCAKKLSKGSQVFVQGRLEQDRWQDKETGQNRSKVKIVAVTIDAPHFFKPKDEDNVIDGAGAEHQPPLAEGGNAPGVAPDDDIPF